MGLYVLPKVDTNQIFFTYKVMEPLYPTATMEVKVSTRVATVLPRNRTRNSFSVDLSLIKKLQTDNPKRVLHVGGLSSC